MHAKAGREKWSGQSPKSPWITPAMAALTTLRPFSGLRNSHLGIHRHSSGSNQGFLNFKKHKFLKESEHFQTLAQAQAPKFMVIGCADSRVCPSNILGFQPGEAFMIRNIANLVPPFENGASETNAAIEFAVNTLEVENIFVIGHSSCAGIETLMKMKDDGDSSFTHSWVVNAKVAKLRTKAAASHLSFEQQCRHYKARKKLLSVHGGYYDFLNCSFHKWTLDVNGSNSALGNKYYLIKDRQLWC
ncbi:hypothetical protein M0R45_027333 [Rubus argutus]|uniref:Carbonic anhydrase n=1 Tax=Rubus argutus TaxID=59490 RepID=A0AAW1X0Q9_RUBAR